MERPGRGTQGPHGFEEERITIPSDGRHWGLWLLVQGGSRVWASICPSPLETKACVLCGQNGTKKTKRIAGWSATQRAPRSQGRSGKIRSRMPPLFTGTWLDTFRTVLKATQSDRVGSSEWSFCSVICTPSPETVTSVLAKPLDSDRQRSPTHTPPHIRKGGNAVADQASCDIPAPAPCTRDVLRRAACGERRLLPACRALHHCPISLSRMEQIVHSALAPLQAGTSAVIPGVTNSNGDVTD